MSRRRLFRRGDRGIFARMPTALPHARASLADAADAPFVAHAAWAAARTRGMRVLTDPALVLVDSGLACDTFNVVCRARLADEDAPARVRAAVAHFRDVRRPFSWWVGPADRPSSLGARLEDAGLVAAESELAMALGLSSPADALDDGEPAPGGLTIARVRTPDALADFAAVCADNWTPPDPDVPRYFARAARALLAPDCPQRLYVGSVDGVPVATAEATLADGMVGLFNVATRAAWRRRGIGGAMTAHPLREARAEGVRTAVLQASADGAGVYARLGFAAFGTVTEYKPVA
jgi:GNAT superfamily N-acetyltransferase